jgi:hypothetical protein
MCLVFVFFFLHALENSTHTLSRLEQYCLFVVLLFLLSSSSCPRHIFYFLSGWKTITGQHSLVLSHFSFRVSAATATKRLDFHFKCGGVVGRLFTSLVMDGAYKYILYIMSF